MVSTRSFVIASVAGGLALIATQKVREQVPGTTGLVLGALAGMVVSSTAKQWLEQNV